ncbi:hypothetical protein [Phreatobacter sp.]|uniref:hypothetical protein n=1 Tax=Phreatobacter sp. TaxID=1966341 RepID=UPI003F70B26C
MSMSAIAGAMVAMNTQETRMGIQAVLVNQQKQADQAVVDLLASAVQATPAPGTGAMVDKTA